jgi:hypothetical protein
MMIVTQTQISIAIYETPYTFCEGIRNHDNPSYYVPLLAINATNEIIDKKECCLDMLYDIALDDGPTLIDNPACLHEIKMIYFLSMMMLSVMRVPYYS